MCGSAEGGPLKMAKNKCVMVGKDQKLQVGACNTAGALGWRFVGGKLTQGTNMTVAKEVCVCVGPASTVRREWCVMVMRCFVAGGQGGGDGGEAVGEAGDGGG